MPMHALAEVVELVEQMMPQPPQLLGSICEATHTEPPSSVGQLENPFGQEVD